ncbi:terminase large subunit [Mesorhizobium sp. IMUNJ 23232]|uniref:terminase large subunit n=1 Tax=Mesorhizobium sp. IMUNJ 23232 TaxID=3376064 RepID=UPI00378A1663
MADQRPGRRPRISNQYPNDPTSQYAAGVLAGKIVAGEHHVAAAERHLKDLRDGPSRGLHWRPELADHALNFPPSVLTITAGAMEGQPFRLLPWHVFCTGSLFGWRLASGRMRFRKAWVETGKGQAKSPWMAAIGLYMGGWYGIARSEVYSIGQDKKTANVLFKDAVAMCRATLPDAEEGDTESLESLGEVIIRGEFDNAHKIEFPDSGSKFQSLANGESISGPRPTLVAADEIHEFKANDAIETWMRAIAKMPGDALMLLGTNTPASTQLVGTDYSEFYQRVSTGEVRDDEAFGFICRVDKADRDTVFDNEVCWRKALPALGITFPVENIRGEVNTARVLLSTAFSVKRLYFGVPFGTVGFWIKEEAWAKVQRKVDHKALRKRRCWLSLDLSKKNDLTAMSAAWEAGPDKDPAARLAVKTWYWTTQEGLADRALADNAKYVEWAADPTVDFTAVPGAVIDKTFVAMELKKFCAENEGVEFLAFDPAGMEDFIAACETIGFPVWKYEGPDEPEGFGLKLVRHGQGKRITFEERALNMPRSIEKLEDRILADTVDIDSSQVTYMCAGNAILDADGMSNRCFDKKKSRGRIDGMVTVAMVVGAADNEMGGTEETSPWDDPAFKYQAA